MWGQCSRECVMCDADRSVEREARKRENDILAIVGSGVQILEMIVESKRD